MGRSKRIVIGAINIKIHPHSPAKYDQLFEMASEKLTLGKIRGMDWGIIGSKSAWKDGSETPVTGVLWRFINIDSSEPWANLKTRKTQFPGEEPIIPPELKPHLRREAYVFFPEAHRLFYDASRFSPNMAGKLLYGIFSAPAIERKFGIVDVHVETSEEALEKIRSIHRLASLELLISLPNADDHNKNEKRVRDRLEKLNARRLAEKYTAHKGKSISPDRDLEAYMQVAKSNGYVNAVGYSPDDVKEEISTKTHPLKESAYYEEGKETIVEVLMREGRRLLKKITRP